MTSLPYRSQGVKTDTRAPSPTSRHELCIPLDYQVWALPRRFLDEDPVRTSFGGDHTTPANRRVALHSVEQPALVGGMTVPRFTSVSLSVVTCCGRLAPTR